MTPIRATDPALWPAVLRLLQEAFAYMEGRIDPPSSLRDLTPEALTQQVEVGEIWVIGGPVACVFLTPKPGALYVGKLAVAEGQRGNGLARRLIGVAEARARERGLAGAGVAGAGGVGREPGCVSGDGLRRGGADGASGV